MQKAQIESIQGKGDWKGQYGTMYTFEVTFNDGTVGDANCKTEEPPYKVGDEVWYEVKSNNERWGKKLRITKQDPAQQGGFTPRRSDPNKDKQIIRGMCFKVAGMAWANQYKHKQFDTPHEVMVKDVVELAKKYEQAFNEWMEE
tara:strand:- start:3013 stop:3444 length:432 start_codon:yes stop_codon:yes gene_type:complete